MERAARVGENPHQIARPSITIDLLSKDQVGGNIVGAGCGESSGASQRQNEERLLQSSGRTFGIRWALEKKSFP